MAYHKIVKDKVKERKLKTCQKLERAVSDRTVIVGQLHLALLNKSPNVTSHL